jgi:hypothetical protein
VSGSSRAEKSFNFSLREDVPWSRGRCEMWTIATGVLKFAIALAASLLVIEASRLIGSRPSARPRLRPRSGAWIMDFETEAQQMVTFRIIARDLCPGTAGLFLRSVFAPLEA